MHRLFAAASLVALMAAAPAWAQNAATTTAGTARTALSQDDRKFMEEAAAGGMAEVKLGQLAMQKSSTPAIREFGRWMATDHSMANNELKQVAQQLGVELPAKIDAEHQQKYDRLSGMSGAQFDREYIKEMLADHQKDVPQFQKMAQSARSPELKAFAQKVTPALQQHLAEAQDLSSEAGQAMRSRTPSTGSSTLPRAGTTTKP
jgi:putative membrane protein